MNTQQERLERSKKNQGPRTPWFYWIGVTNIYIYDATQTDDNSDNTPVAIININDYPNQDAATLAAKMIVDAVNQK